MVSIFFVKKNLSRSLILFSFLFAAHAGFAQMHPVAKESYIHFSIHNFGFKTGGKLNPPEGDIVFNPDDLSKSSFKMIIEASSIDTDNESRDEHLREADYFDVKNYPHIRFVSGSIRAEKEKGSYTAIGTLTLKNKSKEITLPFTAEKTGSSWLFSGSFKMLRKDYDIGGSSTLSNELTVNIKVLAQ